MMFSVPLFSRDVYAYIGQGRLMVEGFNPYENGISALSNYFQLGADKMWTEAPVPYGQLFLWIEQFVVWATNVQPEASVMLFRLAALVGVVLCIIYVPKLAELHGVNPHRALWLTAANPLFLTNFIASVHNDALMIGLALAGLYYCATGAWCSGWYWSRCPSPSSPSRSCSCPLLGSCGPARRPAGHGSSCSGD